MDARQRKRKSQLEKNVKDAKEDTGTVPVHLVQAAVTTGLELAGVHPQAVKHVDNIVWESFQIVDFYADAAVDTDG